jgi:hypothetical protein
MTSPSNPYEPATHASSASVERVGEPISLLGWIMWPLLLIANLAAPIVLAMPVTESAGRWGMGAAIVVFLALGWVLCGQWPALARRLLLGAPFIAISQVFPILHFILGAIAIEIANRLGVASPANDLALENITGESGGLLVTGIVGFGLLLAALACGSLFEWAMPGRWYWASKPPNSRPNVTPATGLNSMSHPTGVTSDRPPSEGRTS